jgi:hypothetical protein
VAYAARIGNKQFVVVDGKEKKEYDDIVTDKGGRIVFDKFDRVQYFAIKNKEIYLVEDKIKDN